jgi:hypothetical protein
LEARGAGERVGGVGGGQVVGAAQLLADLLQYLPPEKREAGGMRIMSEAGS